MKILKIKCKAFSYPKTVDYEKCGFLKFMVLRSKPESDSDHGLITCHFNGEKDTISKITKFMKDNDEFYISGHEANIGNETVFIATGMETTSRPPIFKYFSTSNLENFLHGSLRFTRTEYFNDENEIAADEKSDIDIFNRLMESLDNLWVHAEINNLYSHINFNHPISEENLELINTAKMIIFCLHNREDAFYGICAPANIPTQNNTINKTNFIPVDSHEISSEFAARLSIGCIFLRGFGYKPSITIKHNMHNLNIEVRSVVKKYIDQNIGILCMTKRYDNLDMWKNYAEDSSGYCICFNPNRFLDFDHLVGDVEYTDGFTKPVPLMCLHESLGSNGDLKRLIDIISSNSNSVERLYIKDEYGFDKINDKEKENKIKWADEEEIRYIADIRYQTANKATMGYNYFYENKTRINTGHGPQSLSTKPFDVSGPEIIICGKKCSNLNKIKAMVCTSGSVTPLLELKVALEVVDGYLYAHKKALSGNDYFFYSYKKEPLQEYNISRATILRVIESAALVSRYIPEDKGRVLAIFFNSLVDKTEIIRAYANKNGSAVLAGVDFDEFYKCMKITKSKLTEIENEKNKNNSFWPQVGDNCFDDFVESSRALSYIAFGITDPDDDFDKITKKIFEFEFLQSLDDVIKKEKSIRSISYDYENENSM